VRLNRKHLGECSPGARASLHCESTITGEGIDLSAAQVDEGRTGSLEDEIWRGVAIGRNELAGAHLEPELLTIEVKPHEQVATRRARWVEERSERAMHSHPGAHLAFDRVIQEGEAESGQSREHGPDAFTIVREAVNHPGRGCWQLTLLDESSLLEVAQPVGEQVGRNAVLGHPKVREPLLTEGQLTKDEQSPAVTDAIERRSDPAVLLVALLHHTADLR